MLSLRTLLRHPIQFAIMTLGIALGVAVMVSIDLANASAARAFDLSASAVTGRATHSIVGSAEGVDESLYVHLRTDPQWRKQVGECAAGRSPTPSARNWARSHSPCWASIRLPKRLFAVTWASGNGASTESIASLLSGARIDSALRPDRGTLWTAALLPSSRSTMHAG